MIRCAATRWMAIGSLAILLTSLDTGSGAAAPTNFNFRQSVSPTQLLAQGKFFQSSNDFSDRAAEQYRLVIKLYPSSKEAQAAQFYLGTYYQKKFFFFKQSEQVEDQAAFREAETAFTDYIKKYESAKSAPDLSDAYHSLLIIKLYKGETEEAKRLARKMQAIAIKDKDVYFYQVIWSPNRDDIINGNFDTKSLAAFTLSLIDSQSSFADVITKTRNWCRDQKGKLKNKAVKLKRA
jgi:tetratricopeptide (TPR) repeat protein